MHVLIALSLALIFCLFGAIHAYLTMGGRAGWHLAIPAQDGQPVFHPSSSVTAVVSAALFGCAALVATVGEIVQPTVPRVLSSTLAYALAAMLTARAIADFLWVGFFKRTQHSTFARLDTAIYSPLCFLMALGVINVTFAGL